jgi:hypothetical protein
MTDNSSERATRIVGVTDTVAALIALPRSTVSEANRGWGRAR